jgi:Flp pilus assembly protein protease CpaA
MKKFYFLFLMMLLPLAASADAVQIEGIYYNLNAENKTAEVTSSRSKYSGDIAIPKSVTYEDVTYSVTSIGQSAFSACRSLTSIEIPNSVISIGQDAFYVCDGLTSITIPNGVISIENGAFHDCKGLTSITIPSTVTSIGYYVFSGCSGLTSIVVEAGNTVYDSRDNCNAIIETASNTLIRGCETTVFPNNVTSIGMYAFTGCSGLTSVTIPKSVTSIETPSFSDCNNLTSIVVESGNTVYDSRDNCNAIIKTAHNYLVAGCNTTVIPNGVTHIAADAFCGCKGLTSVEIPNSVTTILGSAFRFCDGLTSVTIPNSVTYLGSEAFYGCVNLTSVKISNSLTSILVGVFHNCSSLTSVEIPNSVTSIGDLAFASCRSLVSVEIPNSVTSIGKSAFSSCRSLVSVEIPNSVTSIGKDAFKYCSSLTSVTSLATTPPQADENAFEKLDIPLYVPKGTRDAYLAASPWNKFKEIIDGDNTGGDDATNNDKTKRTIHVETAGTLPDLISADDKYLIEELTLTGNLNGTDIFFIRAMAGVNLDYMKTEYAPGYGGAKTEGNLKFLDLSDANIVEGGRDYYRMMWSSSEDKFGDYKYTQANTISECMFADCWMLEELILPRSVTTISSPCADVLANKPILMSIRKLKVAEGNPNYISPNDCNAIIEKETKTLIAGCSTTVIPEDVTSIGANAFRDNQSLTSITIPSSVTSIRSSAFYKCSGLTSVTISNSVTSIGSSAFSGCSKLTSVTIPNSVTSIGSFAFSGCSKLTSITIPNGVKSIEEYTFAGCSDLASVTIPNSVTSIGIRAFNRCSALTSLEIPNSVTSIDNFAFDGCSGLTSISIPSSVTSINRYAFDGCSGLESVTSLATTPPQAEETAFTKFDIPLYVPKGTRDAYLAASPWNKFKEIVELDNTSDDTDEEVIKISSALQTTYCSESALDFTGVEGIKAYVASGYDRDNGTIWLMRVFKVPANEGILLMGDEGEYKVPRKSTNTYYANFMKGTLEAITINETEGEYTNYYLSNGTSGVGFYKVDGTQKIGANRAYLPLLKGTTQSGTRFIGIEFEDDGTTGVKEVKSGEVKGEEWFTLQGHRVAKPGKGLYIRNGKKVVVR